MPLPTVSSLFKEKFLRFLVSGGLNTVLTYGAYLLLLKYMPYALSYAVAYLFGVVISYFLNRYYVFDGHRGLKSVLFLPLVYVAQFLLSMVVVWVWVDKLGLYSEFAPLAALLLTIPVTYIFTKIIFME